MWSILVIIVMNTFHVSKRDGIFCQQDISIPKLTKGIVCRALTALFMEQHCGRYLLRFLRGHDKNHRTKDNGQSHRLQYVSLAYHHVAKVHFFSLLTKICISCKIHSTKICISCNGNVTKPGKTLNCCPLLCRTPQLSCRCGRALVRAFRLLVFGIAWHSVSFTYEGISCVPLARCPRALSAHPILRPNGLMWGY